MEVQQVLHMVEGVGETSYASNSILQKISISKAKPIIESAITHLCSTTLIESIGLADLGCSSGPNTLLVISLLIDAIEKKQRQLSRPVPELRVFLNDLPGNDFNTIFMSLPNFYQKLRDDQKETKPQSCFIAGVPGSFYGRLFPTRSLHFVHSSYSLHFLSQFPVLLDSGASVALNKGNIYISKTSPLSVAKAYLKQYESDFSLFLKCRSEEMVPGGRMVLTLLGRTTADPRDYCYIWNPLAQSLKDMVLQGMIEEKKLDSFNMPFYSPSVQEIEEIIGQEGSFDVDEIKIIEVDWDANGDERDGNFVFDKLTSGLNVAKCIRAVAESLLVSHFGKEIIDELFQRFSETVGEHMSKNRSTYDNLVISMTKRSY